MRAQFVNNVNSRRIR